LLCVRNACEGNELNQNFVDSLQPQEVLIQNEEWKKQGIKVELDKKSGKFNITADKENA
jgi:hypothetical protein